MKLRNAVIALPSVALLSLLLAAGPARPPGRTALLTTSPEGAVPPPKPYGAIPSERQLRWQEMEINAFLHFTVNTFTGQEWGYGDEDPSVFSPTDFQPDQI